MPHSFSGRPQVIQGNFQGRMPSFAGQGNAGAFASPPRVPHGQAAIERTTHLAHRQGPAQQPVVRVRRQGNALAVPPTFQFAPSIRGRPLTPAVQQKMEAFFGADFSAVRVHTGPQAQQIGAIAFTMGSDIYFAPGQYLPHLSHGQRLIGHELTHVVQQRAGRVANPFGHGAAVVQEPHLEMEAERLGTLAVVRGRRAPAGPRQIPPRRPAHSRTIQRLKVEGETIAALHNKLMEAETYKELVEAADKLGEVTIQEKILPYGIGGTNPFKRLIVINPQGQDASELANVLIFELLNAADAKSQKLFTTATSAQEFALAAVKLEWEHRTKFREIAHAVNFVTGVKVAPFPGSPQPHTLPSLEQYNKFSEQSGHMEAMGESYSNYG